MITLLKIYNIFQNEILLDDEKRERKGGNEKIIIRNNKIKTKFLSNRCCKRQRLFFKLCRKEKFRILKKYKKFDIIIWTRK